MHAVMLTAIVEAQTQHSALQSERKRCCILKVTEAQFWKRLNSSLEKNASVGRSVSVFLCSSHSCLFICMLPFFSKERPLSALNNRRHGHGLECRIRAIGDSN